MDVPWSYQITGDQRTNPAVFAAHVKLPDSVRSPDNNDLLKVWNKKNFSKSNKLLTTWNRAKDKDGKAKLIDDPHWIAVRNGTPLHIDPKYPRYSHHLKIRVDAETICRGLDKQELVLQRGLFYILDTHSPHQVLVRGDNKNAWNVAVSIDSHEPLPPEKTMQRCLLYAMTTDFLAGL